MAYTNDIVATLPCFHDVTLQRIKCPVAWRHLPLLQSQW